jgi:ribose-phosphate pyrophosphokinase
MINKKRIKPNEIHSMELVGEVEGRNVVIVDDMADTLGTLKKASELIMEKGAKSVRAIATHGVLSGKAYENLESSVLSEVLVSDSIPSKSSDRLKVISCDKLIAKAIWGLASKKSINEINSI